MDHEDSRRFLAADAPTRQGPRSAATAARSRFSTVATARASRAVAGEEAAPLRDRRPVTPAEARTLARIRAELSRLVRYDDESIVHPAWIRQRYDLGAAASFAPARQAAVRTAWHEAGHAVAALAVGAAFSSASIRHGSAGQGRVHGIRASGTDRAFVIDAAGQIAERLRDWSMLAGDDELRAWLATWRADGGDARRFRRGIGARFASDEVAAWRYCEQQLTPLRLRIRQVARALLVHPRHLPYPVVAAIADGA